MRCFEEPVDEAACQALLRVYVEKSTPKTLISQDTEAKKQAREKKAKWRKLQRKANDDTNNLLLAKGY